MITAPGFIHVPQEEYHLDPCPEPSLSSGIARIMLTQSPKHAWTAHPRLNEHWEAQHSSRMDIGSYVHEMLLDDGRGFIVLDYPDWRSKAAREARDMAYNDGLTPILSGMEEECMAIVTEAQLYIRRCGIDWNLLESERSFFWQDTGGIWCRAMTDKISSDRRYIVDYKTTSGSASMVPVTRRIFDAGYHIQQAFYERGLNALDPEGTGRRTFLFLFQEINPPYACQLARIDTGAMEIARRMVDVAVTEWMKCILSNKWPAYPASPLIAFMPAWAQGDWLQREMEEPNKPLDPEVLNAG